MGAPHLSNQEKLHAYLDSLAHGGAYNASQEPLLALQGILDRNSKFVAPTQLRGIQEDKPYPPHYKPAARQSHKLQVASVSFPIDFDDVSLFYKVRSADISLVVPTLRGRQWLAGRIGGALSLIKDARVRPHLICINELSCPVGRNCEDRQWFVEDTLWPYLPKRSYIVAGSHHDPETAQNLAALVPPQDQTRRDGRFFLVEHPKKTSAISVDERLQTPSRKTFPIYETPYGKLGVVVCFDSYDMSQILSLIGHNITNEDQRAEVLLVPAYNMKDLPKFAEACRTVSELSGTAIVVAHSEQAAAHQFAFRAGKSPNKNRLGPEVTIFEIDLKKLDRESRDTRRALRQAIWQSNHPNTPKSFADLFKPYPYDDVFRRQRSRTVQVRE